MKGKFLYLAALVVILLTTSSLQRKKVDPFETFSLRFNDLNFDLQKKTPNPDVVFVAVDEPSVNKFGRWPWKREVLAQGIDKLSQANVLLMDMIFSESTDISSDEALADSIGNLQNSVCGFFLRENSTQQLTEGELDILSNSSLDLLQSQVAEYNTPNFTGAPNAELNIETILDACTLSGSFSTLSESDHLLRSYPIAVYFDNLLYPSLAIQGLRLKYNSDISRVDKEHVKIADKEIMVNEQGFIRLNFYNPKLYNIVSFLDVIEGKVSPEYFKNKIVILGITEVGAGDVASTPVGMIPGPLLHYTFLSNFLSDHLLSEPRNVSLYLTLFMAIVPFIMVVLMKKVLTRVMVNFLVYTTLYIFIRYLYVAEMLYIDLFYPLVAFLLSLLAVEGISFNLQEKSGRFMRSAFSSYLSGDLLNQLIKNPDALKLGGEKKELTILFSDIRGFTTISESMSPEELIKLLNRYFTPMTDAVLKNKGMLDKYIGDAVMAFFNAPVDVQQHADAACITALEMIEELNKLNQVLESEGKPSIHIGIGINTADVVVGNMGSNTRFNYTVIGDGVNLASRVEGLTKNYGVAILITEFTLEKISQDKFVYREIEPVKVKGKDEAVLLYELMENSQRSIAIKKLYEEALALYKENSFSEAQKIFEKLVDDYNDTVSKYFLPLIEQQHPWGVHTMKTK